MTQKCFFQIFRLFLSDVPIILDKDKEDMNTIGVNFIIIILNTNLPTLIVKRTLFCTMKKSVASYERRLLSNILETILVRIKY